MAVLNVRYSADTVIEPANVLEQRLMASEVVTGRQSFLGADSELLVPDGAAFSCSRLAVDAFRCPSSHPAETSLWLDGSQSRQRTGARTRQRSAITSSQGTGCFIPQRHAHSGMVLRFCQVLDRHQRIPPLMLKHTAPGGCCNFQHSHCAARPCTFDTSQGARRSFAIVLT